MFSAQDAFSDFCYAFVAGHVNSNCVTVFKVCRYDRFADKWFNETKQIKTLPDYCKKSRGKLKLTRQ